MVRRAHVFIPHFMYMMLIVCYVTARVSVTTSVFVTTCLYTFNVKQVVTKGGGVRVIYLKM